MKAKYYQLFSVMSFVLVFAATVGIGRKCGGWMYQPKAPKHLIAK